MIKNQLIIKKPIQFQGYLLEEIYPNYIDDTYFKNKIDLGIRENKNQYISNVKGLKTNYHFFDNDIKLQNIVQDISPSLFDIIGPFNATCRDSWGCRYDDYSHFVKEHHHEVAKAPGFSGILYLSDEGPGTYFPELDYLVKDKKGKIVIFHPSLLHSVKEFKYKTSRYIISFNFNFIKKWDNIES